MEIGDEPQALCPVPAQGLLAPDNSVAAYEQLAATGEVKTTSSEK